MTMDTTAVKLSAAGGIIEGWGIPFGSPTHLDRHGEYFDASTDLALNVFPGPRPLLISHGTGPEGPVVVGRVTDVEKRDLGWWVTAALDQASPWFDRIKAALARGVLSFSSASLPHLVQKGPDGKQITRWPLIELSLTDRPASSDARVVSVRSCLEHFAKIGVSASALKQLILAPGEAEELDYLAQLARIDAIERRGQAQAAYKEFTDWARAFDRR